LEKNTHLEGKHPLVEKTPTWRENTHLEEKHPVGGKHILEGIGGKHSLRVKILTWGKILIWGKILSRRKLLIRGKRYKIGEKHISLGFRLGLGSNPG
jgi:hypothetical protein